MKKIISFILTFLMTMSVCFMGASAEEYETVDVFINGELLQTDQPAIIVNDRTMVPIRAICEALNCTVKWEEGNLVYIINPIMSMGLQIDNKWITKKQVDNMIGTEYPVVTKELDVAPMLYNDRTLVPARAISETMNAQVEWNSFENSVDITMEYDFIFDFDDGYAIVEKDGKRGAINQQRQLVVPVKYNQVLGFREGCATVILDSKEGMVDETGKEVLPCEYETVSIVLDGYASVKKDGKWGSVDSKGNIIVPCIYDEKVLFIVNTTMEHMKNRARVVRDGKWGYVNTEGKEIIPCIYETSAEALSALMGI